MSGWGYTPPRDPGINLPAGIQVATMGSRIAAWFLDGIIAGLLMIVPVIGAIATGAVGLNQAALDQVETYSRRPFDAVTAPLFHVDIGLLALWAGIFVAINGFYYAASWVSAGGTPAQRVLKVRVVNLASGSHLSIANALLRWIVLQGLATASSMAALLLILDYLAKTPTNQWLGVSSYGNSTFYFTFGGIQTSLVSWAGSVWALVLLATAATNPARRGLHDWLSGSVVVSPVEQPRFWPAYPAYPAYPYPPQANPYWPATGGPTPPGYPGYSYPPQAPNWPPQGSPGYPYPYPYPYSQQPPVPAPPPAGPPAPPTPPAPPPPAPDPADTRADPPPNRPADPTGSG